jgi:type II secretory pathway pseudopilin PulG
MVAIMIIAGITAALFELTMLSSRAVQAEQDQMRAFQMAESAIDRARAVLVGSGDDNSQTIADLVRDAGDTSNSVEWDTTSNSWVSYTSGNWSSSNDVGLDGQSGTNDQGEGDGFPTAANPGNPTDMPGESNVRMYRFGGNASDPHLYTVYAVWWGNDGIDNNGDGDVDETDDDVYEMRTYTIRATGIYRDQVVELETLLTRDPPPDPVDPNNPPGGFLAAISVQVGANSGAPSGTVDFFNSSAANVITGIDSATSITGAASASSSNDTDGIQLAASGASLTLDAKNTGTVTGDGATSGSSFNNNGTFIGDIIDTIADGAKSVAKDTSGLPSSNGNAQNWGTASDLKVVYHDVDAHGPLEVGNGTATDTSGTTWNNSRGGFGILVVDVENVTSTPPISFSGANSSWEGIVIVRVKNNLAPTGPNGVVKATGSGSNPGQIGSVVVYGKNQADFSGGYVYKNNGNRPTQFSLGAIQEALQAFNDTVPPDDNSEISDPIVWRPIRRPGIAYGR